MATYTEIKVNSKVVSLEFNTLAEHPLIRCHKIQFPKEQVIFVRKSLSNCLDVYITGLGEFQIDLTGAVGIPIETINDLVPTDLEDLYQKINTALNL